ncbi:AAA family ATPase [Herbaspirillum frisingense]|uniref:AAA family ATPase n=1 Tax=Herbaspirillum frisingense TaxID=92645 RepID=UPI001F2D7937|nr:AAA family ATPase [Herbaspirillum frisingense]UIN19447.1 AAA family ATPase [Herbaspirillum frisingense]
MLTRIAIDGFKNLSNVEISFGPFTCIAGANGVGKSNLFDAIMFLRDLADFSITEAAARVRDPVASTGDLKAIFRHKKSGVIDLISLEADFVVPPKVLDDFGREAVPSTTFLRYGLQLKYVPMTGSKSERIEIVSERLSYVQKSHARRLLGFPHTSAFRESIVRGRRTTDLISTEVEDGASIINLHQDGSSGRPFRVPAAPSPRTILGGINTDSHPTVLAARREMQSWSLLQLEPTALRQPDNFSADAKVSPNGAHLPATLLRLNAASEVASELANFISDVQSISVDQDEGRRLNTLMVTTRDGVSHPARALSDGTLRFLALSILGADPDAGRLLCLEEPENGIHPSRIPAILNLLESIVVDPKAAVDGISNPLRQVIINTHSPSVVSSLKHDTLIVSRALKESGSYVASFCCLDHTWRANRETDLVNSMQVISRSDLLSYLTQDPVVNRLQRSPQDSPTVRESAVQLGLFDYVSDLAA